ncbi:hypothetical protein FB45DRAFT_1102649 [Roridomyces roridus]|uniref:Uncharacterized protein n=1 Tax=Roridomyces roridus TaxID=1738132 RepID=A0AAD7FZT9_9AGAR|nr:hypothetical protein FB45DRAFT_1102649 [Roridomyces roridus]
MSSDTTTSLSVILGAVVMAGVIGALFFGAASIQTYNYLNKSNEDHRLAQFTVRVLWVLNAFQFAVYTYTIWYYVVDAYETAWAEQVMHWSFKLSVWLAVALVLVLDILYSLFVLEILDTALPILSVFAAVIVGNVVAVVLGVKIILFKHFTGIYDISRSPIIYLFFIFFCIKAVGIAAVMVYHLSSESELEECILPEHLPEPFWIRFSKMLVGSSLIVAICSFAVLACHLAMPRSMSCVVVYMAVSKLYHNCYLSMMSRGTLVLWKPCIYPPTPMKTSPERDAENKKVIAEANARDASSVGGSQNGDPEAQAGN